MSDLEIDRLFIAVPELTFNVNFVQALADSGYLSTRQLGQISDTRRAYKKGGKVLDALSGGSIVDRLMAVAPELLSIEMVDILRGVNREQVRIRIEGEKHTRIRKMIPLITETQGHALRIAIRTLSASTRGGLPTDKAQVFTRLSRIAGVQFSNERIDMWRSMGLISAQEATRWRGYLVSGTVIKESLVKAVRAKSLLDALAVIGELPINKSLIAGMVQSGIITPRLGLIYNSMVDLGIKEWKVFQGVRAADGYQKRLMLILSGSFNAQLLDYLLASGVINNQQWSSLQIAEVIARRVNDKMLEDMTRRRFRVQPGEEPIKTFARASRVAEGDLLRMLADAADESKKEARALAAVKNLSGCVLVASYPAAEILDSSQCSGFFL